MKLAIIDFNRTIYDPDTDALVAGADSLLAALVKNGVTCVLLSRDEGRRRDILKRLGVESYFTDAVFVQEKTVDIIMGIMNRFCAKPVDTYVIGDYLHEEIRKGNQAGANTIHFKSGRFNSLLPETKDDIADSAITSLSEAIEIIR